MWLFSCATLMVAVQARKCLLLVGPAPSESRYEIVQTFVKACANECVTGRRSFLLCWIERWFPLWQLANRRPRRHSRLWGCYWTKRRNRVSNIILVCHAHATVATSRFPHYCLRFLRVLCVMLWFSACFIVAGKVVESLGKGQSIEVQATQVELHGKCVPGTYPLAKKGLPYEFLRSVAHIRARTNTVSSKHVHQQHH